MTHDLHPDGPPPNPDEGEALLNALAALVREEADMRPKRSIRSRPRPTKVPGPTRLFGRSEWLRRPGRAGAERASKKMSPDSPLAPIEGAEATALFDAVLARVRPAVHAPADDLDLGSPASVRPPSGRRWGVLAAVAAILLAAVAAWMLRPGGDPTLPSYGLTSGAGDQSFRADPVVPVDRARYSRGSRVLLIARPAADVTASIEARAYVKIGGTTTRLEVQLDRSPTGAVRLDGVAGSTLALPEGEGELILLIRPAGLATEDADLLQATDPAPAQRLVHPFSYHP